MASNCVWDTARQRPSSVKRANTPSPPRAPRGLLSGLLRPHSVLPAPNPALKSKLGTEMGKQLFPQESPQRWRISGFSLYSAPQESRASRAPGFAEAVRAPDPGGPNAPSSHLHDPLGPRESVTSEPAAPGEQQAPVTVRVRLLVPSTTRLAAHGAARGSGRR